MAHGVRGTDAIIRSHHPGPRDPPFRYTWTVSIRVQGPFAPDGLKPGQLRLYAVMDDAYSTTGRHVRNYCAAVV